ncbi:hypothetical protein AXG93_598s1040 [Marchantia polymorpha subsp. ruderalis]|uniref:Uncharacterized protein n=1 Tax=Marchantia polymorpha subsp. ruderalis TaxID=1480154 RepID=A0A176VWW9_MARPO|nr:hypothetical protein AXG93_598s1040 [Marchantia polymorpha subsp. ruderalis]
MVRDGPTATLEATLAGWALPLPFGSKVRRDTRSQWRCSEGSTNFAPSAESLVAMDFAGLPLAASAHSLRSVKTLDHFKRVYWLPETNLQLVLPGEFKELTSIHMLEICVSSHTAFEVREVLERPF